jgi:hypothetical protein
MDMRDQDQKALLSTFNAKGWIILPEVIPTELLVQLRDDMHLAEKVCHDLQIKNKIDEVTGGTVHHLLAVAPSFLEALNYYKNFDSFLEGYFSGKYIINSFGGNIIVKGRTSYANNIHRDIRTYSGTMNLLLNSLIMLDDFTKENGATYLMSGSHLTHPEKPNENEFYQKAEQAIAKAGSILFFNSNLWHAAGCNTTEKPRRSITPMFCKPSMKQQFDYCRNFGEEKMRNIDSWGQQVLGYYSRTPVTLDEWYQPPEQRMYRPGQG